MWIRKRLLVNLSLNVVTLGVNYCTCSPLSSGEKEISSRIIQTAELDKINRSHPSEIDVDRHVVVVLGITGASKSSTANTIRGSRFHQFEVSESIVSVTKSTSFKDFSPQGNGPLSKVKFRVVDTPGLMDTNRKSDDIVSELKTLRMLAPHGISAFLVCVPMGRVTEEQERALVELVKIFGSELMKHSVLVVTNAVDGRQMLYKDQLLDKVQALAPTHFMRQFIEGCNWRVVGVENKFEPGRSVSALKLQQAVLDTVEANQGERYHLPDHSSLPAPRAPEGVAVNSAPGTSGVQCEHTVRVDDRGRTVLTIECVFPKP